MSGKQWFITSSSACSRQFTNAKATIVENFEHFNSMLMCCLAIEMCRIIIQLYFRPQWVHRKDNTNIQGITCKDYTNNQAGRLSQWCKVI